MSKILTRINAHELSLTNLDKLYWPDEGISKGQMLEYYRTLAPYLLPHLINRPFTLVRYPNGIRDDFFYQKECPEHAPDWVKRIPVSVDGGQKQINFVLCNDLPTLIWLANLGCIEVHAWAAKADKLENPDFAVFDLDPAPPANFSDSLQVGLLIRS
ncbi:MAG TPA: DNA polymerase domain-containing protein, partial [Desulfobacteria bacterium]|nr:DNA polymerase domain-containing protein [Desulfobacteria bacterium]